MSKRFSILAAALFASGRSRLTASLDHSASRLLEFPPRQFDDPSIKERGSLEDDGRADGQVAVVAPAIANASSPRWGPGFAYAPDLSAMMHWGGRAELSKVES